MNQIEPRDPRMNMAQTVVLIFAALYWLSPLDLIPFIPIDDVIVVVLALMLAGVFGLFNRGSQ